MKKFKFLLVAVLLLICGNSFAQFTLDGNGPKRGYMGMFEAGYAFGTHWNGMDYLTASTSHGYQFNPYIFAGVGVGVNYYHTPDAVTLPVFADIRGTFLNNTISPYIDLKVGYTFLDVEGLYVAPSIGCRYHMLTFGVGYEFIKPIPICKEVTLRGVSLKLGINF